MTAPVLEWREDDEGDCLTVAAAGPYRLRTFRRECNADDGAPIFGWAVAVPGQADDEACYAITSCHRSVTEAEVAAEAAAVSLLLGGLAAFPVESPKGSYIVAAHDGFGIAVPCLASAPYAIALGRALICAGMAAGKERG